jgi:glycosyltransferase involved in cell wall biosynthesis
MTISVVIPAYNEEKLLPATLKSLSVLERKPDEVIVVDASSTDKTAAIARKYGATVITVPHYTVGYSREIGLEKASGDILAYTDADTIHPKDWLIKIEQALTQPGVSCVFGTFRVPDGPWAYKFYINVIQPVANQLWYWVGIPMATGQNLAFWRKKALAVGGIPKNFKIAEDIEIARRLQKVGKVVLRQDLVVIASGRRGNEGWSLLFRIPRVFFLYFIFRKAHVVGFPDVR